MASSTGLQAFTPSHHSHINKRFQPDDRVVSRQVSDSTSQLLCANIWCCNLVNDPNSPAPAPDTAPGGPTDTANSLAVQVQQSMGMQLARARTTCRAQGILQDQNAPQAHQACVQRNLYLVCIARSQVQAAQMHLCMVQAAEMHKCMIQAAEMHRCILIPIYLTRS